MLNPEPDNNRSNSTKMPDRPAHESIERPQSEQGNKAEEVANKAAVKAQNRIKNAEDVRGPFRNFGQ